MTLLSGAPEEFQTKADDFKTQAIPKQLLHIVVSRRSRNAAVA